jgi:uncharacterized protein DUF6468
VSYSLGFTIEVLVAILLGITIVYCAMLNNRLKRLKADEQSLKGTIAELITATQIAERAVAGLKATAHECEATLGERLRAADRFCADLGRQVKGGEAVLARLARVVAAGHVLNDMPAAEAAAPQQSAPAPVHAPAPAPAATPARRTPDPKALAAAARSFADRQRERIGSTLAA